MDRSAATEDFFAGRASLKREREMRLLLANVPQDAPLLYDLTFYAAFVSRLFTILKREGAAIQGYERMQQSLADSVEQVKQLLERAEKEYAIDLGIGSDQKALGGLVEDLTALKQWLLTRNETV